MNVQYLCTRLPVHNNNIGDHDDDDDTDDDGDDIMIANCIYKMPNACITLPIIRFHTRPAGSTVD